MQSAYSWKILINVYIQLGVWAWIFSTRVCSAGPLLTWEGFTALDDAFARPRVYIRLQGVSLSVFTNPMVAPCIHTAALPYLTFLPVSTGFTGTRALKWSGPAICMDALRVRSRFTSAMVATKFAQLLLTLK